MKILFDQGTPVPLSRFFVGHAVSTTFEKGWSRLTNGELLQHADADFDAFITTDQNLEHQQNLTQLPLAVIVPDARSNRLVHLLPFVPAIQSLLASPLAHALYVIESAGNIVLVKKPRT